MADERIIEAVRKTAEHHLEHGSYGVMRAFNLTQDSMWHWTFDSETRERAERLMIELVRLFHDSGGFRVKPEHLRACAAEGDQDFQRFLRSTLAPVKRRPRGGTRHPRRRRAS